MFRRRRASSNSTDAATPRRRGRIRTALSDAGLAAREHLIWRPADAIRNGADAAKAPFEGAAWSVRRGVFWRLGDRFDALGPLARGAVLGLALILAAGAAVSGLLLATPDKGGEETAAVAVVAPAPEPVSAPAPASQPQTHPILKGATPTFALEAESKGERKQGKNAKGSSSPSSATTSSSASDAAEPLPSVLSSSGTKPAAAVAGTNARQGKGKDAAVAGPKALATARRFAAAFVLYETGRGDKAKLRKAFAATTTPELRRSLLRRPPRLPANVKVPKAKVLNVVPGPSHNGVYSVSVALLRVGLTSELRLDMEPPNVKGKSWHVTNILG